MTVVINGTTGIDTGTGSLIAASSTTPTYLDLFEDTDNGSNYVRLIAPTSIASNQTITLPDGTGTVVVGSAAVSAVGQIPFSTDGSSYTPTAKIVSGTAVTCAGQTSIDFPSIPSWAKRITVMFSGVSTNGTSPYQCQIGDSGGVEDTGYAGGILSGGVFTAYSAGFLFNTNVTAASVYYGSVTLLKLDGNLWTAVTACNAGATFANGPGSGSKTLSGTLDRVRITTVNGADTFDTTPSAGSFNIIYE